MSVFQKCQYIFSVTLKFIFTNSKYRDTIFEKEGLHMTFGGKLKKARTEKHMTQKQLAEMISVKHNSVSNWENDINKPDPDTIELLCGVLDITPNYLLASSPDDFSPFEKLLVKRYRNLDDFGRETVDIALDRETERVTSLKKQKERIEELENTHSSTVIDIQPHLEVKAAHQRTDIEVTEEMIKHDDDIMDDDDF